jgi:SAM-dependent methyltransferase
VKDLTNPAYLLAEQYRTAGNLNARIAIHARFSTNPVGFFRWMFELLDAPPDARLLELGTGSGQIWRDNAGRIPPDWRVTLTDLSPGMLGAARAALGTGGGSRRYALADAQAIPFAAESFDLVFANYMLYHVPDRESAYAEIRRVLRPGGLLYTATNGADHMRDLDRMVRDCLGGSSLSSQASQFTLESGGAELARWFTDVRLLRYEDALLVTEVEPLLAYVESSETLAREDRAALEARFAAIIALEGAVRIGKDPGLFIARKAG